MSSPDNADQDILEKHSPTNKNICIILQSSDETRDQFTRWIQNLQSIKDRTLQLPKLLSQRLELHHSWVRLVYCARKKITNIFSGQEVIATIQYPE